MHKFSFIGGPGVGKGTFAKLISARYGFVHISLGDIIRREIEGNTAIGKEINDYVVSGQLVPDLLACEIVNRECQGHPKFILDGFPRTLPQAAYLESSIKDVVAVNIVLDDDVATQKMLGRRLCTGCGRSFNVADVMNHGNMLPAILPDHSTCPLGSEQCKRDQNLESRSDDTIETIQSRFKVFHSNIAPILNFYRERSCLKEFIVKRGVDDVDDLVELMKRDL